MKNNYEDLDSLIVEAIETVVIHQKASVSFLQTKLKLGYNRASRVIDKLEEIGVVGPKLGRK